MPDILTPAQVAECRERAERATDGPWIWNHGSMETDFATVFAVKDEPEHAYPENQTGVLWGDNLHADTCFIAHARTDIPALCATVEALREENERLRNVLTFVACGYACVHYPDQDRDHSGIQYPDCVDPDIECCVADALRARELSR